MKRLAGRIALITGATSGIGAATARLFAEEGAGLVLTGRNGERGARVRAEVEALGSEATFIPADVTDPDEVATLFAQIDGWAGGLDILVNNAGVYVTGDAEETSIESFDRVIASNGTASSTARSTPCPCFGPEVGALS